MFKQSVMTRSSEQSKSQKSEYATSRLFFVALWVGLVTGVVETVMLLAKKFILHDRLWLSQDFVWMVPVADVLFFAIVGMIVFLIAQRFGRLVTPRLAFGVFVFLGFFGIFGLIGQIHEYARLILAVGCAIQVSHLLNSMGPGHLRGLMMISSRWMIGFILFLSILFPGWQVFQERSALATLPSSSQENPNVLMIVLDTVRSKSMSLYGHSRPTTPYLEQLAKYGIVFDKALSVSPWTLPSHATMFTGRFPHELSANWLTPLDNQYPTLAEFFGARGYTTFGIVGNLLYCTYETGLNRGFIHYEDYPISLGMIIHSSWITRNIAGKVMNLMGTRQRPTHKTAEELNQSVLQRIDSVGHRPFFGFINYMDAHEPYLPPKPFAEKFSSGVERPDRGLGNWRSWSPAEHQIELDAYEGAIAYLDSQVGFLMNELKKRKLLENTLVIVTSDHGDLFGEHALIDHGNSLYRPLLHVPLMIIYPSYLPSGIRVSAPITLRDIPSTILDIIQSDGTLPFPGNSLARFWKGVSDGAGPSSALLSEVNKGINRPSWLPVSKGNMKSLVSGQWHYIFNGDGVEELYDFENDLDESRDLAKAEGSRKILERLRHELKLSLSSMDLDET